MTITCSVSPWPQEATVSWMLNEKRVYPDSADYVLSKNQASVLESKASAGMMGNWSCVMHKGRKQGKATTALTVRGEGSDMVMSCLEGIKHSNAADIFKTVNIKFPMSFSLLSYPSSSPVSSLAQVSLTPSVPVPRCMLRWGLLSPSPVCSPLDSPHQTQPGRDWTPLALLSHSLPPSTCPPCCPSLPGTGLWVWGKWGRGTGAGTGAQGQWRGAG